MKIINFAIFTLLDYFRRSYLYAEVILVAIMLFLFRDHYWLLGKTTVYPSLGIFCIVLATVTTHRLTSLEMNPRIYIPLTKALNREDYLAGKTVAAFALDSIILLILFGLAFFLTGIKAQFSFIASLLHLIPLFFVLAMSEIIALCCSSLVSNKLAFFWGIVLLIFGSAQPWKITAYVFPPINQLILNAYQSFHLVSAAAYLLSIVYIVVFYRLALYLFGKRELHYESK